MDPGEHAQNKECPTVTSFLEYVAMSMATIFYAIGGLLFAHAGYSSYEAQHMLGYSGVPLDIVLETCLALGAVVWAALISTKNTTIYKVRGKSVDHLDPDSPLRDIIINEPMEYPDKYLMPIDMVESTAILEAAGPGPYSKYELRLDMIDLAKKRAEYKTWLRSQSIQKPTL